MPKSIVPYPDLLTPPIARAAYSDRTAWLMAIMSKLAYVRFEDATPLDAALSDVMALVTGVKNPLEQEGKTQIDRGFNSEKLLSILKDVADAKGRENNLNQLEQSLGELRFSLIKTFSVHIPLIADTQAYIAKINEKGRAPFLVLAFRGTEPKKPTDIKSDLDAVPHILGRLGGAGKNIFIPANQPLTEEQKLWPEVKVHPGFWDAFKAVESEICACLDDPDHAGLPLYITGHSLGGALAVVSAFALKSDRIAASYTFGGPRVGNLQFGQYIKPPVYRFINASDIVPRMPPGLTVDFLTLLCRGLPFIPYMNKLATFLEKFRGYRHYGDLRYLTAAETQLNEQGLPDYKDLCVLANPPQIARWAWLVKRWFATNGHAAVSDHSIDHYEQKLAYWAHVRMLH